MPLTDKGNKILRALMRPPGEGGYGPDKGERVFYALRNSGKIKGVDPESSKEGKHSKKR